jgi:hypothetical protein
MKKVFVLLLAVFISTSTIALADTTVIVPAAVSAAFASRFPAGKLTKWEQRTQGYIAVFRQDGKKLFAYYEADGTWKGTETPIKWTKDLPAAVRGGWVRSDYGRWYVEDMKKIEQPDEPLYVLHIDNGPLLDADRKDAFREEWLLFFNGKGELVRKERTGQ